MGKTNCLTRIWSVSGVFLTSDCLIIFWPLSGAEKRKKFNRITQEFSGHFLALFPHQTFIRNVQDNFFLNFLVQIIYFARGYVSGSSDKAQKIDRQRFSLFDASQVNCARNYSINWTMLIFWYANFNDCKEGWLNSIVLKQVMNKFNWKKIQFLIKKG